MDQGIEYKLTAAESPDSSPVVAATVGRVMTTLLMAKVSKLQTAISLSTTTLPKVAPLGESLEQSLWFLHKYVKEAAERGNHLDLVILPIVQNSLAIRDSKHRNQELILLNWLFQDEIMFEAVANKLASVILGRFDRYMALGWCILCRNLIESDITARLSCTAIMEKRAAMLKIFCQSIAHLISIVHVGSNVNEGFELPTRLAVAASDFILSLTVALTQTELPLNSTAKSVKKSLPVKIRPTKVLVSTLDDADHNSMRTMSELPLSLELSSLLWNNLDEIISLLKKLKDWSKRSRSLHSKGLERVLSWLQGLKEHSDQDTDIETNTDVLLLSSCWKHYGALSHLEDRGFSYRYKDLLQQYLSGVQYFADNQVEERNMDKEGKSATISFFLNCLLLLLGRLDNQQFGDAITEFGTQISQLIMSQLQSGHEGLIDGVIYMLKALIAGTNHISSRTGIASDGQVADYLPILTNLLDERDAAAKAVVKLVGEYCLSCSDSICLNEVFKCLYSKTVAQRMNAVDVLTYLIHNSENDNALSRAAWHDIANHLLRCLGDEEMYIHNQAASFIPLMDPPLVLPALVLQLCSTNQQEEISAEAALLALLGYHKEDSKTLLLLLDNVSELSQNPDMNSSKINEQFMAEPEFDANKVLKLLSEWTKNNFQNEIRCEIAGSLIDKMLAQPSNAIMVKFLSLITEYLAEAVDVIFRRLILYMRDQKWVDLSNETMRPESSLFSRICPLLIIRLLPITVFDDLNSNLVYGDLSRNSTVYEDGVFCNEVPDSIAAFIINRALSNSEFRDVQKLAAELCGRIHPEVLIPILCSLLESAIDNKDVMKIKVCLFSFCSSLTFRGLDAYSYPDLIRIRKIIGNVLKWRSCNDDEVAKAQHGCIDCLALMLCNEIKASGILKGEDSVVEYVIHHLSEDMKGGDFESESDEADRCLSFRLCMANVLIVACQRIPDSGKKLFVKMITPRVVQSFQATEEAEIKAACVQILLSVAYHLKSYILLQSNELVDVALKCLRHGSVKEKMGGVKLVGCLMAGEEEVVDNISSGLMQARACLQDLLLSSDFDCEPDLRRICQQLLCFSLF